MSQQHPNIGMVKLLRRLLFELNVIGQQGQRQCALLHRILPDDKIRNTAPKLVQVGGDLIVHDQVHPPCAAGIDQRAACARITRCDRVDTGQLGSLLQQTECMLVNHIAVIVRQRDLLQLKRRVGGKQLLLKALQTFAVRTVIHTGRNDRSHRAALPRHQTHQLGHRTAGRNVFLPDIAQPTAPLVADYDRANAMDMISPLLGNTEFDCIIANNDAMALGAVEALKAKGMDPTSIPIVGIDATVDGIQAIKDGTLAMTVFQDANGQGYGAVKAAVNLIEGKAINDGTNYETDETGNICWVPFEPVTPDNVADYE